MEPNNFIGPGLPVESQEWTWDRVNGTEGIETGGVEEMLPWITFGVLPGTVLDTIGSVDCVFTGICFVMVRAGAGSVTGLFDKTRKPAWRKVK